MVMTAGNKLVSGPPAGEIEEVEDFVDLQFRCFKNFEIVPSAPSDHHFNSNPADATAAAFVCIKNFRSPINRPTVMDAARTERINKEWEVLKTGLPNTIFVRAYSSRPDLMRAAIIGLSDDEKYKNNPYGYGLFFFDIMLPAQYPVKPPLIYHQYYGVGLERFNMAGSNRLISCFGEEDLEEARWEPDKSSVLDALGVIQRCVLGKGPQMKGERCNEVFMLSHIAMVNTLRAPPSGFEDFVRGYFRKFSHEILMQLKGFMGKLSFENLVKEFEENGSYCRHLLPDRRKIGKDY